MEGTGEPAKLSDSPRAEGAPFGFPFFFAFLSFRVVRGFGRAVELGFAGSPVPSEMLVRLLVLFWGGGGIGSGDWGGEIACFVPLAQNSGWYAFAFNELSKE